MKTLFVRFVKNESGATAIEYGLIAALMSVGISAGINILSGDLQSAFTNLGSTVSNATTSGG